MIYEGVEVLDFADSGEVFQAAAGYGASDGQPAFRVYTVSRDKDKILGRYSSAF